MERDEDWDEDQDEDGKRRVMSQAPSGFSDSLNIQYPTRNFQPNQWLLGIGCWALVVGCWLLDVDCWCSLRAPP
jgi:hypothetical protein